jgi:uncharacterized protein YbjT (DUF2867 family)
MTIIKYPKLLIAGATGHSGKLLTKLALEQGYDVSVLVRDEQKIADIEHPNLHVFELGMDDVDKLAAMMADGFDAILLTLGIYHRTLDTPLADITENLLQAIPRNKRPQRIICMSSLGAGESVGQGTVLVRMMQRFSLKYVLLDKNKQEQLIKDSGIAWTLLRPPRLVHKKSSKPYKLWLGSDIPKKVAWKISNLDSAKAMLALLEDDETKNQALQCSY